MTAKLTKQGVRDLGGNRPIVPTCSHSRTTTAMRVIKAWSSIWGEYETRAKIRVCTDCRKPLEAYPQ